MIRPLRKEDLPWLVGMRAGGGNELERLAAAAATNSSEHHALVSDATAAIQGIVVYRMVPGAAGAGEIELFAAQSAGVAAELIDAATNQLRTSGARLIIAEYAGSADSRDYAQRLEETGFRIETVIADYYADGVPLIIAVVRFD